MKTLTRIFLTCFYLITGAAQAANETVCSEQCNTPFGTRLGQSYLTKAYSNCSDHCVTRENNYVSVNSQPIFTGMKWQCVEYARRWLIDNRGITFTDVEYAYHIWDLKSFERLDTHTVIPLQHFKNRQSPEKPQVGDLLINSKALAITGHVSVIVGVDHDSVTIAEQNYFNRHWEASHYARRLLLIRDNRGFYRIVDEAVIGWVGVR